MIRRGLSSEEKSFGNRKFKKYDDRTSNKTLRR